MVHLRDGAGDADDVSPRQHARRDVGRRAPHRARAMTAATVRKSRRSPSASTRTVRARFAAVRGYARAGWTTNVHDPGITTLELLCYALTDLCYRACYPVEDLLAVPGDNAAAMAEHFWRPRRALPNAPLTALDYRRLLLDVPGVRNAWIADFAPPTYYADVIEGRLSHDDPAVPGVREVHLRGLHSVRIEYADGASAADKARILAEVEQALQANRCLCEDFADVAVVEPQDFVLCAEIELEPSADPLDAYASILLATQRYLAPGVPRHTREELRLADPELFEGPAPRHGFIVAAELEAAELRTALRLSDVIGELMDVPGVKAVRDIVLRPGDLNAAEAAQSKWEVSVRPGRRARLDPQASRIVLYKGGMPLPRPATALARYDELKKEDEKKYAPRPSEDAPIPLGRFRDPAGYETVQKHFPALYGIGDAALPFGASLEREAQARQLEGWLLFFDQLMANGLAQLAAVRELFSLDPDLEHTYFSQPVDELMDLYPSSPTPETLPAWKLRIQVLLDSLAEDRPAMLERRNRFLDHLMARYAERLQDYLEIQAALFGATPEAAVRAKCAFLARYPELGAARGLGFDYTRDAPDNVSGLEQRLIHREMDDVGATSTRNTTPTASTSTVSDPARLYRRRASQQHPALGHRRKAREARRGDRRGHASGRLPPGADRAGRVLLQRGRRGRPGGGASHPVLQTPPSATRRSRADRDRRGAHRRARVRDREHSARPRPRHESRRVPADLRRPDCIVHDPIPTGCTWCSRPRPAASATWTSAASPRT